MDKREKKYVRRITVTLAVLLGMALAAMILDLTGQVAAWVAQVVIALCFGRICFLAGYSFGKNGKGWRV